MKRKFTKLMAALALLVFMTPSMVGWGQTRSEVTDVMNQSWTGITGTSYSSFSGKAGTASDAVYAGNCAGDKSSIQLRSNNNNSGIVSTTSGGTVTKVTVTWQSDTQNGRTLNVYGSNSAYSTPSDLYGNNAGTLIGTIVKGTSTELTITDSYAYIGMRSASGAMYLTEINVTWETGGSNPPTPTTYTVTYKAGEGSGTDFLDSNGPYEANANVTLLTEFPTAFTAPTGYEWNGWEVKDASDNTITINNNQFTMPASNVTVTAQYTQSGGGSNTGSITITQNEVANFTNTYNWYTWTSNSISGQMYAYKNSGMQFNSGKDAYWVYNTTAIPGRITSITMTKASGTDRSWTLKVGNSTLTTTSDGTQMGQVQTVGTSGATWNVTGNYDYFLLYVSGGATVISSIVINYETVTAPTISFNPNPIALGNVLVGQQIQETFTVSQANLSAGITLSASHGTLSPDNIAQGAAATQVTWTYTPASAGAINATITANSGNLQETLAITGTAKAAHIITIDNMTHGSVTASANSAIEGETITLTVTPDFGYTLDAITVMNTANNTQVTVTNNTFEMPDAPVTVSATFIQIQAMTVAQAIAAIQTAPNNQVNGAYVAGIISEVVSYQSNYNSITYWISDDGESNELQVYSGLGLNGAPFSALTDLSVGDEVVVYGDLKIYDNVYEFNYNSQIVSLTPHQAQQYNLEVTSVTNAEIFVFDATNPDDNNWEYLFEGENVAQVTEGTPIALSVSAEEGYAISELMVNNDNHVADIDGGVYLFNMPAQNVTITVTAVPVYNITYSENGVETQAQVLSNTLTLPVGEDLDSEFSFAGWTTTPGNFVTPTAAGTQVTIQGGETFYAVYARTEGREAYFEKVTEDLQDWSGNYLIVAVGTYANNTDYSVAFDGSLETLDAALNHIEVEIDENDRIEYDAESTGGSYFTIAPIVVDNETKGWSIQSASGYYIGRTANSNGMNVSDQTAYSHEIEIDEDGNSDIISSSGRVLRFNKNANDKRFRYYATGGQEPIQLYKEVIVSAGITTYYTRVFIMETAEADITITGPSIIPSGSFLNMGNYILSNATADNAGNLVIEDGAQVVLATNNNDNNNYVYARVLKNIEGYGEGTGNWYLLSAPTDATLDANPNYPGDVVNLMPADNGNVHMFDLYSFDQTQQEEWQNFRNPDVNNKAFYPQKGLLYARKESATLEFIAPLTTAPNNNHSMVYNVSADFAGWNLVGNAMMCDQYVGLFDHNDDCVLTDYFRMNAAGTELELCDDNSPVAPMEGFFMQAPNGNGYNIYLHFSSTPITMNGDAIDLVVTADNVIMDRARVRFGQGGMLGKLTLNENTTQLYFQQGNARFAVVRSANEGEMPVSFKAETNGTYTISVDAENMEMTYLHLIDNMTGADVDLLATPSYTFSARTTDYASRFRLVFSANDDEENISSDNFAFFNGSEWVVSNTGEATLQVVDVLGRVLSTETVNGNATINVNQPTGVYMLRLVNGNNVRVQKVVVR